jgi:hypothetical protein
MEQKSGRTQKTPFSVSEIANKYQFGAKTINLLGAKLKVVPRPFVNLLSRRIVVLSTCYFINLPFMTKWQVDKMVSRKNDSFMIKKLMKH